MPEINVNGKTIEVTDRGYLVDVGDWDEEVACELADQEMIELTNEHWEVVKFLRDYYKKNDRPPTSRGLLKNIRDDLGKEKANSRYLYDLFPKGPAKQGYKIAGLPAPGGCI